MLNKKLIIGTSIVLVLGLGVGLTLYSGTSSVASSKHKEPVTEDTIFVKNKIEGTDTFNQKDDDYIVEVYQPTCVHCNNFKPTLLKYANQVNALPIYSVDATNAINRDSLQELNVKFTPTLIRVTKKGNTKVAKWVIQGETTLDDLNKRG